MSTIDPKEIEFFSKFSEVWWISDDTKLLRNLSKFMGQYIIEEILKTRLVLKSPSDVKVLDVGCGGGFLTEKLARVGFNVIGVDISTDLVNTAKKHASQDSSLSYLKYAVDSIENHCLSNSKTYDVVVSNFVLEHVNDHDLFIKCCGACVKSGGLLFLSALSNTYLNWFGSIFIPEYILNVVPRGTHQLQKCINASDTEKIMKSHNFVIKETRGLAYNYFSGNFCWVPTNSLLYVVHAVRM